MSDSLWLVDRFDPGLLSLKPTGTILVLAVRAVSSLKSMSFFDDDHLRMSLVSSTNCARAEMAGRWLHGNVGLHRVGDRYWPSDGRLGLF